MGRDRGPGRDRGRSRARCTGKAAAWRSATGPGPRSCCGSSGTARRKMAARFGGDGPATGDQRRGRNGGAGQSRRGGGPGRGGTARRRDRAHPPKRARGFGGDIPASVRGGPREGQFRHRGVGPDSASPHHEPAERTIQPREPVVCDSAVRSTATALTSRGPFSPGSHHGSWQNCTQWLPRRKPPEWSRDRSASSAAASMGLRAG